MLPLHRVLPLAGVSLLVAQCGPPPEPAPGGAPVVVAPPAAPPPAKSAAPPPASPDAPVDSPREHRGEVTEQQDGHRERSARDEDGDGIPDRADKCPSVPEDHDSDEDGDGCPESSVASQDRDGDGVADASDVCPDAPEDRDGFSDGDGCPDPDNDTDGVPDASDACPSHHGRGTADGCPALPLGGGAKGPGVGAKP